MKRVPLFQTIIVLIGVAILLALGTWQVKRLEWKQAIIATLEQDYAAMEGHQAPMLSPARLQQMTTESEPLAIGKVRGRFLRDDAILLGPKVDDNRPGYHLLVPLLLSDGTTIIVNAGWVDAMWKDDPGSRYAGLPQEPITITGILRKPDWNSFTSKNSPANDMWFRADTAQIAQTKNLSKVYPFVIYASATQPSLHGVKPLEDHWLPRNKHLQYALFWYAMGAALIGVYAFYWRSRKAR